MHAWTTLARKPFELISRKEEARPDFIGTGFFFAVRMVRNWFGLTFGDVFHVVHG